MASPNHEIQITPPPTYTYAVAVTPSDTVNLARSARGFIVELGGESRTVSLVLLDGTTVVVSSVLSGVIYPIAFKRINATGTDATGFVALW